MKTCKKIFCIITALLIILSSSNSSHAAVNYSKVTNTTTIDAKYGFSPRFIPGVTKFEGFGGYSYEEDLWHSTTKNSSGQYGIGTYSPSKYYPIRLTSANKGKVGVWYRNVGEYKGKAVDLKITIMDWEAIKTPITIKTDQGNKLSYPTISFQRNIITINPVGGMAKAPTYRLGFYDHNTGNPIEISGYINFIDIDDNQYVESDDFTKGYLASDTFLSVEGNRVVEKNKEKSDNNDKFAWMQAFIDNRSYVDFTFSSTRQDAEGFPTSTRKTRGFYSLVINGETLAPFDTPPIEKAGESFVVKGENISYDLYFTIPKQPYESFVIKDTLSNGLQYKSFSVIDDTGTNVTSIFSAKVTGQNIVISANNPKVDTFNYKSYKVIITATADKNFDFSKIADENGKVYLENTATITAKTANRTESTKASNKVESEVLFKIATKADENGIITESISNISGGTSKTINFKPNVGYKVKSLIVDGQAVDITKYNSSYDFSNILDNHSIEVNFTPTTDNKITVTKKIPEKDVFDSFGNPLSIIKLTGTDLNGNDHSYFKVIELTKDNLKDGYYQKSVTFPNLIAGDYKAEEIETSRYSLARLEGMSGASVADKKISFDLVNNKSAKGTFVNSLNSYEKFSHNSVIVNIFE